MARLARSDSLAKTYTCEPLSPPAGGQGGRLHRARVNDHRARRRRAPPFPPPAGGQGGTRRSWTSVAKTPAFSQRWVCR